MHIAAANVIIHEKLNVNFLLIPNIIIQKYK